jgi:hypothetical protein
MKKHTLATLCARNAYLCPIARAHGAMAVPHEIHHARAHNTKANRKRFPHFINSLFNLMAVNHDWHMMYPSFGRWPERKVQWYEDRLAASATMRRRFCCD